MQTKIKPKALKQGDTISLIAPAGPVTAEQLTNACKRFEGLGFHVLYENRILDRKGYLAGEDDYRLNELHKAFADKNIDAIVCIRGGYGCSRIVDQIDFELIANNPKIFVGFSDITILLNAIWQKTRLVTFHGVVGNSGFAEYTKNSFLEITKSLENDFKIYPYDNSKIGHIYQGKASGILVGGNLSLIVSLIGTEYDIDFTDKLVFIEDIDEPPYKIDRMLTQLLLIGNLKNAAGIILGDFRGCDVDSLKTDPQKSLSLNEVLNDRLAGLKIPVLSGFSFGHIENQAIFPVGINAEIDTTKTFIKLLENPVS